MQVRGIHHVNVNVRDLAAAMQFYVDGLGFTVLPRPDVGRPGAWLAIGVHQLHLAEDPDAVIDPRQHFALHVDDLDGCVADLQSNGITPQLAPLRPGAGRQAFVMDPSGNRIELNEPGV